MFSRVLFLWLTGSTACQYISFGTNCLWDPYLQVGGNQPLYFDQMTNIYNHYTVVKSRIKVTLIPNTVNPFVGGILTDDDGVPAYTSLHEMCEQPSSVYVTSQRDAQVVTLTRVGTVRQCSALIPDNDRLQGNVSSNPAEIQAFILFMRPIFTGAENIAFDYMVTIDYDTVWHELKEMASS